MKELTLAEQETALYMSADDRNTWHVFSDDPVLHRKMDAVGATLVRQSADGGSKWYTLPANQLTIRQPTKPMSEERKAQLGDRMRAMRAAQVITVSEEAISALYVDDQQREDAISSLRIEGDHD